METNTIKKVYKADFNGYNFSKCRDSFELEESSIIELKITNKKFFLNKMALNVELAKFARKDKQGKVCNFVFDDITFSYSKKEWGIIETLQEKLAKCNINVQFEVLGKKYSFKEVKECNIKLDGVAEKANKSNLSPLEKLMYAYTEVTKREYMEVDDNQDKMLSRRLFDIISNDNIVCVGYCELLKGLMAKLDVENVVFFDNIVRYATNQTGTHATLIVYIDDPKYKLRGYYYLDPTNDSTYVNGKDSNSFIHFLIPINKISNFETKIGVVNELAYTSIGATDKYIDPKIQKHMEICLGVDDENAMKQAEYIEGLYEGKTRIKNVVLHNEIKNMLINSGLKVLNEQMCKDIFYCDLEEEKLLNNLKIGSYKILQKEGDAYNLDNCIQSEKTRVLKLKKQYEDKGEEKLRKLVNFAIMEEGRAEIDQEVLEKTFNKVFKKADFLNAFVIEKDQICEIFETILDKGNSLKDLFTDIKNEFAYCNSCNEYRKFNVSKIENIRDFRYLEIDQIKKLLPNVQNYYYEEMCKASKEISFEDFKKALKNVALAKQDENLSEQEKNSNADNIVNDGLETTLMYAEDWYDVDAKNIFKNKNADNKTM